MNPILVGLTVAFVVSVPMSASPGNGGPLPTSGWTLETVGLHGGSAPPSLALDSGGVPHILYCPPGDVRFASRTEFGWTSEHVVFTIFGGVCGELAFGPSDVPHITTPIATDVLKELYGTMTGGAWDLAPYPGGLLDEVNARGEPQVVAYWRLGSDRFAVRYLTFSNGTWVHEDVEIFVATDVRGSAWASIELDAAQRPHLLYYDQVRGDVRYAFRDAAGWHVEVVEHAGSIGRVGRGGQLALRGNGIPVAAYGTGLGPADLRLAERTSSGWVSEVVDDTATFLVHPTLALGANDVPCLAYEWIQEIDASRVIWDQDLLFRCREATGWSREVLVDGLVDAPADVAIFPQFPDLKADPCGNPHLAFYYNLRVGADDSRKGVYYATKGEPCQDRFVAVDVDPDILNFRSKGKWVTAYVDVENASGADIDPRSLTLNGVAAAWVRVLDNDTLMAKFDRQAVAATLAVGENVVTLAGSWKDGGRFTAADTIRVITPRW